MRTRSVPTNEISNGADWRSLRGRIRHRRLYVGTPPERDPLCGDSDEAHSSGASVVVPITTAVGLRLVFDAPLHSTRNSTTHSAAARSKTPVAKQYLLKLYHFLPISKAVTRFYLKTALICGHSPLFFLSFP